MCEGFDAATLQFESVTGRAKQWGKSTSKKAPCFHFPLFACVDGISTQWGGLMFFTLVRVGDKTRQGSTMDFRDKQTRPSASHVDSASLC